MMHHGQRTFNYVKPFFVHVPLLVTVVLSITMWSALILERDLAMFHSFYLIVEDFMLFSGFSRFATKAERDWQNSDPAYGVNL